MSRPPTWLARSNARCWSGCDTRPTCRKLQRRRPSAPAFGISVRPRRKRCSRIHHRARGFDEKRICTLLPSTSRRRIQNVGFVRERHSQPRVARALRASPPSRFTDMALQRRSDISFLLAHLLRAQNATATLPARLGDGMRISGTQQGSPRPSSEGKGRSKFIGGWGAEIAGAHGKATCHLQNIPHPALRAARNPRPPCDCSP